MQPAFVYLCLKSRNPHCIISRCSDSNQVLANCQLATNVFKTLPFSCFCIPHILSECRSSSVKPVRCNSPLIRLQYHITAIQQLRLRQHVCRWGRTGNGLWDSVLFYKAISNSSQCLLDNPDTVHLPQQQGGLGFISIFSPFFFFSFLSTSRAFCLAQREWESVFRCSGRRKERAIACGAAQEKKKKKTFWGNCCNSAIIKYSICRPCQLHSKMQNYHAWFSSLRDGWASKAKAHRYSNAS